jgi:hypothetical protein
MGTATTAVRATGVPKGYVEHVRELSKNGMRVRAAIADGEYSAPKRKKRRRMTESEAEKEAQAIRSALGL